MSDTALKETVGEPLTKESFEEELARLCTANALPKKSVVSDILFPALEKHFESAVDREVSIPFIPHSCIYMSDEGFLTVFAVVYTLARAACKEMFIKAEKNGEYIFLTLSGKTDKNAANASDALALNEAALSALSVIADSSGFSLSLSVEKGILTASMRFLRFRAVPVSSYSCSLDFVESNVSKALSVFAKLKVIK
jgi:hypothetical protein